MFKSFSLLSPCLAHGLTWEMVLSSLNLFLPVQTVEDVTSRHAPTSLQRELIQPLDHLALEPALEENKL